MPFHTGSWTGSLAVTGQGVKRNDWGKNQFLIALRERDLTWAEISRQHGMHPDSLRTVVGRRWPRGEQIISGALGVPPEEIWPSRYPERQAAA